jgi:Transposase IS66 family
VLDPGRGRTKIGRLWGYAIDDRPWNGSTPPAVVHLYAEDRKGEHPAAHLAGFEGILQVDGYSGFKRLLAGRPPGQIKLAFCWAHPSMDRPLGTREISAFPAIEVVCSHPFGLASRHPGRGP